MTGTPGSTKQAKDIIISTIIALLILFGAYAFFYSINPGLTTFSGISLPEVKETPVSERIERGVSVDRSRACTPAPTGSPASEERLRNSCWGADAWKASRIANLESGGRSIPSGVGVCSDGNPGVYGIFQINLTVHNMREPGTGRELNCPSAFSGRIQGGPPAGQRYPCRVINQELYNKCIEAARDPDENIRAACGVFRIQGWRAWEVYKYCRDQF